MGSSGGAALRRKTRNPIFPISNFYFPVNSELLQYLSLGTRLSAIYQPLPAAPGVVQFGFFLVGPFPGCHSATLRALLRA